MDEARAILREVPLIDGHNDTPWQYRKRKARSIDEIDLSASTARLVPPMATDIPRLREGLVGGQFWAIYAPATLKGPEAVEACFEQIDVVHRMVERHADVFEMAYTADDVERIHREGKIASLIGLEGGYLIGNSLPALRMMRAAGARYLTLTHTKAIDWADASTDAPVHGGLTPFGREVVREMNRLGMIVDLAHVSHDVMRDALDVSEAPVAITHSGASAVHDHARNVPDDVLRRIGQTRGVVMVPFVPPYLSKRVDDYEKLVDAERDRLKALHPDDKPGRDAALAKWRESHPAVRGTIADVADHIDHIRKTAGVDCVGVGGDFEGFPTVIEGLEDVSCYPALFAELLRRGYSREDVKKIAGLNMLRVMREVEGAGARLRLERPPSTARIEDLDGPRPTDAAEEHTGSR